MASALLNGATAHRLAYARRVADVVVDATRDDEVSVVGSFGYASDDFREAFELVAAGALPLDAFVTDRVALREAQAVLRRDAEHAGLHGRPARPGDSLGARSQ